MCYAEKNPPEGLSRRGMILIILLGTRQIHHRPDKLNYTVEGLIIRLRAYKLCGVKFFMGGRQRTSLFMVKEEQQPGKGRQAKKKAGKR
jgi:hypothetical protein